MRDVVKTLQSVDGSLAEMWQRYIKWHIDSRSKPASFELLAKVHKTPLKWRPIVSCSDYLTFGLGEIIAEIL